MTSDAGVTTTSTQLDPRRTLSPTQTRLWVEPPPAFTVLLRTAEDLLIRYGYFHSDLLRGTAPNAPNKRSLIGAVTRELVRRHRLYEDHRIPSEVEHNNGRKISVWKPQAGRHVRSCP